MKATQKNDREQCDLRRKYIAADFRAVAGEDGSAKKIVGHPAIFNTMTNIGGWYNETIERGAFDGCDFDDVLFFTNHAWHKVPLARSRRNNQSSTMRLSIDDRGLYMEADVDTENNAEARQVYSSIERGDMDGMSFAFRVKEQKWENLDSDTPTRRITKISKVFEVSAVNEPAYEDTDIYARDKGVLENARAALDNAQSSELEIYKLKNKILGGTGL